MTPRALELFAGCGGAALGLSRAGFDHAALVEWDRHACATLRAADLGPVIEGDVRNLGAIAAAVGPEPVDVLWSSFPCQAWSTAGKRRGAADERNGWPWTLDAIDRFKPTWFVGENVRGLTLHRRECPARKGGAAEPESCAGCYFSSTILGDLRRRFAHVGWWLLDAADYGVPQHRQRVILWAGPAPVLKPRPPFGPSGCRPHVGMGTALRLGAGQVPVVAGSHDRGRPLKPVDGPSPCIGASYGERGRSPWTSAGAPFVVYTEGRAGTEPDRLDVPAPTVTTTEEKGTRASAASGWTFNGGPDRASDALFLATGRRRLTVAECALLQDFPADYPFQGPVGARYRQIGNAVPPKLAETVGAAVLAAMREVAR